MALIIGLSGTVLAGCGAENPQPGPDAGTAACTALLKRLPDQVLSRARADPAVTGVAAWGDPAIVLRCGVSPAAPSDNPCADYNGVDWVFTETDDVFRFVSYHRTPAVEVTIPTSIDRTTAPGALIDLAKAVAPLPKDADCT